MRDAAWWRKVVSAVAVMSFHVASLVASDSPTARVSATFNDRARLRVSSQLLQFVVTQPGDPVSAYITFEAAARTSPRNLVVVTVEQDDGAVSRAAIEFESDDEGLRGHLSVAPAIAARWFGSGVRSGRLVFTLRADSPGLYVILVRLRISLAN